MAGKKSYILGVDPGISGALCILSPRESKVVKVFDVPTVKSGIGDRKMINVIALSFELGNYANDIELAIIEDVHSMPRDGAVGAFAFGKSTGILIGVIGSYLIPTIFTPASVWKNVLGLSRDKNESRALATKKYPLSADAFKLKKNDGRAEATLLADFGRRFY